MNTPTPRRRRSAIEPTGTYVKASVRIRADLHLRVTAAAMLRGKSRDDFVGEALIEACRGVIITDRTPEGKARRAAAQANLTDRLEDSGNVSPDDEM